MIRLEEINQDNWLAVTQLQCAPQQSIFAGTAIEILARAYVYRNNRSCALAICTDEAIVGVMLVRDLDDEPACYDLQEILIGQQYQNRGYCQAALQCILERLEQEHKYSRVDLCVHKLDAPALHVYMKHGFYDTGYVDPQAPDSLCLSRPLR